MVSIFKLSTPQTLEQRAALRTAIAALAAILIAFMFHLDNPYWSGMTVVLLANIYTGSIIDKAILRIVGTVIGAWFGYFLAGLVANSLLLYLLANFLLISLAIYYYSFSPHAYAYLLGALGAFIVISQLAITPEDAFYVAIWRPVEIGLGVLVSAASALCIFPNNIQDNLLKDVDLLFDQLGGILEQLSNSLISAEPTFEEIAANNLLLKIKLRKSIEMLGFMRRELGIKRERIDQFRAILDQFLGLSRTITYFISSYKKGDISTILKPVAEVFAAAQYDLQILKNEFFASEGARQSLYMETALANLYQSVISRTTEFETDLTPTKALKPYLQMEPLLQQINAVIRNLSNVLIHGQANVNRKTKLLSSQQLLRNDPDIIISSIKTGLASILALSFWLVTNWPGGLNGIISSIVISIKKNLFEMRSISLYRFLGCLIGGGLALFPLAFFAMNLYDFILILFLAVWGFSYFSFKYPTYSYIGLQANIALIISMAQAGGPPIELEPALERLAGIVIGIVASFLVANVLWRTDFFSLLTRHLRRLFRFLVYNLNELLLGDQKKSSLYDLTSLFWLCRGLLEAFPEGYFKAKKQERLEAAKKRFVQMTLIQATISHIYESINKDSAHAVAAKYKIELEALERDIVALYQANKTETWKHIKQRIDKLLPTFDLSPYYAMTPSTELSNCISYIHALNQLRLIHTDLELATKSTYPF